MQLLSLDQYADSILGDNCKMFDVLWANRGIGYIEEGTKGSVEVFFDMKCPQFLLPKGKKIYILHSCVLDALQTNNIVLGANPVIEVNQSCL